MIVLRCVLHVAACCMHVARSVYAACCVSYALVSAGTPRRSPSATALLSSDALLCAHTRHARVHARRLGLSPPARLCCMLQVASVSHVVCRLSCCMLRATCRRYIMDEDGKWTLSVRASPVVHTSYGPSECTYARTHARTCSRTHARLPEVPPPPLPLPSAVLAVLHHAGAPGRSCASRAARDASVARCASHDARFVCFAVRSCCIAYCMLHCGCLCRSLRSCAGRLPRPRKTASPHARAVTRRRPLV